MSGHSSTLPASTEVQIYAFYLNYTYNGNDKKQNNLRIFANSF